MSTKARRITVSGIDVQIDRKAIKNLHLGVYPPDGRVRVAAPKAVNDDAVRLAVVTRLPWIKKQRAQFEAQPRQSARSYISGESHYFMGRRYRLSVVEHSKPACVVVRNRRHIDLYVRPGSDLAKREKAFQDWYRRQLREFVAPLVEKWSKILSVDQPECRIKRMKTKWGSCSTSATRVWLNLELAKKDPKCIEYVVAHELTHLLERTHNERFVRLMNKHIPLWRVYRDELNSTPLGPEVWK